jgi:hypothetical protein
MSRKRVDWKLTWSGSPDRRGRVPETWEAEFGRLAVGITTMDHGSGVDGWIAVAACVGLTLYGPEFDCRDDAMRYAEALVHVFSQKGLENLQLVHQELSAEQEQRRDEQRRMEEEAAAKRRAARERKKAKGNTKDVLRKSLRRTRLERTVASSYAPPLALDKVTTVGAPGSK